MTGGAVRKKMEGKFCPFAFSLAVIHWGLELWAFLERARGREWNVFSHCSSLGDPTAWASLVLVSWSPSWGYTSGVRNVLGSSSAPDHPVRCPEGWLPELFFRRWCFLLVCRAACWFASHLYWTRKGFNLGRLHLSLQLPARTAHFCFSILMCRKSSPVSPVHGTLFQCI